MSKPKSKRVFLVGATGTIGRATVDALLSSDHEVVCFLRKSHEGQTESLPANATLRFGDVSDPASIAQDGICGERFDAIISCLASRTGAPQDAWNIDYQAHMHLLEAAKDTSIPHMVLLSAICVQKPKLAFQHAKLAFENALISSGLTYSIVRPTAYFKSLSGQIERVQKGKPFLVFGDGLLTATKPISDQDLANFLVACLHDPEKHNAILPIGGPGEAFTPLEQAHHLFSLIGGKPKIKHVPVAFINLIIGTLKALSFLMPSLKEKAELAKIGKYYATESMLVWDKETQTYDEAATPSYGSDTLFDFYEQAIKGKADVDLGDHRVF